MHVKNIEMLYITHDFYTPSHRLSHFLDPGGWSMTYFLLYACIMNCVRTGPVGLLYARNLDAIMFEREEKITQ